MRQQTMNPDITKALDLSETVRPFHSPPGFLMNRSPARPKGTQPSKVRAM